MKTLLVILVTAGFTFASAYLIVSNRQAARAKNQVAAALAQWQTEKAALESELASAKSRPVTTSISPTASTKSDRLSARAILDKLVAVNPGSGVEHNRNLRLVVYFLESLTACGQEAAPAIKEFFAQNQDIDYTTEAAALADATTPPDQNQNGNNRARNDNNNGNDNIWQFRRGGEFQTDFAFPPSLRLGLVNVLKNIGGGEAETALVSILENTSRGIEVNYIATILQEMAPDKYRATAVAVATDLLRHPPTVDNPDRADLLAKSYLYDVLKMYNDTSFVAEAQTLLVDAGGRLDRNALNYLNSTLKEQAVPALYSAYNNPNLTNPSDRMNVSCDLLGYAGDNTVANQFFTDTLHGDIDNRLKMIAIAQLLPDGGGIGQNNDAPAPTSSKIGSRVQLLTSMQVQFANDMRMSQMLTAAIDGLNNHQPVDMWHIFLGGD